ncbi:MAG: phospholipid carrier-dependent glycosyltransferase [Neisseriales bacterium]|nr:MAG: phospholipid carrier-dependent glycosyltransferase [Neisseriales bacterium]
MLSWQITLIIATTIGCIFFGCYYLLSSNDYKRSLLKLDRYDYLFLIIIVLIYIILSLINFGEKQTNNAAWSSTDSSKSLILRPNPALLNGDLYFKTGVFTGALLIQAQTTSSESLITLAKIDPEIKDEPQLKWNNFHYNSPQAITAFYFTVESSNINPIEYRDTQRGVEIQRLALYSVQNQQMLPLVKINDSSGKDYSSILEKQLTPLQLTNVWFNSAVFDEYYYAAAAEEYLKQWGTVTQAHPPLAMLIIALGICLFGLNPFGWRILANLSGIILIPLVYIFTKRLTGNRYAAMIAVILLSVDFMHFVISRMASIEPFVTLFLLCEYLFLFQYLQAKLNNYGDKAVLKNIFAVGLFSGLAIACKWSGLFSLPAIMVVLVWGYLASGAKPIKLSIALQYLLFLVVLPLSIYCLSFVPLFTIKHATNFAIFMLETQKNMYQFHTHEALDFHNIYASKWWTWPLVLQPMSMAFVMLDPVSKLSQSVGLLGNPLVWWGTSVAVIVLALLLIFPKFRKPELYFILLAVAAQYLSYIFISRLSYIYYFYSVLPLVIVAFAYLVTLLLKLNSKMINWLIFIYVVLSIWLFIMFFPALSGLNINRDFVYHFLLWFSTWQF